MLPIIENAKKEILDALSGLSTNITDLVTPFRSSFEAWKVDWTKPRAEKLDLISGIAQNADILVSRGVVKSVQTGYFETPSGTVGIKVTHAAVSTKAMRIVQGGTRNDGGACYAKDVTATSMDIVETYNNEVESDVNTTTRLRGRWQVIDFY